MWILCCSTALRTRTSSTTVASHAVRPSILTQRLAMWCCKLNDELLKYVQSICVQKYKIREIQRLSLEAERKVARMSTQNPWAPDISVTNIRNLLLSHFWSTTHGQDRRTRRTTVHESDREVKYTIVRTFQPIKIFYTSQSLYINIYIRVWTLYRSRPFQGKKASAEFFDKKTGIIFLPLIDFRMAGTAVSD